MTAFDNIDCKTVREKYESEAKYRWGKTEAYKEYKHKTSDYTADKWKQVNDGLNSIFAEFAECMENGNTAETDDAQTLVKKLQNYITENYYTCTKEILAGLGQMYASDERFKANIDVYSEGAAEFVSKAIYTYCINIKLMGDL